MWQDIYEKKEVRVSWDVRGVSFHNTHLARLLSLSLANFAIKPCIETYLRELMKSGMF